jgi:hypothetical protein
MPFGGSLFFILSILPLIMVVSQVPPLPEAATSAPLGVAGQRILFGFEFMF